jgi:tetratricopeptide (TPR) repeat protein
MVGWAFDRVDTLALLAGNVDTDAARTLLCARGINFTPDAGFKEALLHYQRTMHWENLIFALTAKTIIDPPDPRVKAYQLLEVNPSLPDHAPNVPDADLLAKALKLAPNSGPLNLAVARTEIAAKNYAAAKTHAMQAVIVWRESAEAEEVLAASQLALGNYSDALLSAREAAKLAPSSPNAQFILGAALVGAGQFKEAVAPLATSQRHAAPNPDISRLYGIALLHSGDAFGSIAHLQKYLDANKNDAYAHYLLGVAYREMGRKPEAIEQFDKAGLLSPTSPLFAFVRDRMNKPTGTIVGPPAATQAKLRAGAAVDANTYTNPFLGFSYTFPPGWHVLPAAACMNPTMSIFFPDGSSDPLMRDLGLLGQSVGTLLLCVSRDHKQELQMDSPSIRVTAFDSNAGVETLRASTMLREIAKLEEAPVVIRGGAVSSPDEVTISGRAFTKLAMTVGSGDSSPRQTVAGADLNGYVVLFELDSIDSATAAQLVTTLGSIKFTEAVATVRPAN